MVGNKKYKVIFDIYHLCHLPQFEPVIEMLKDTEDFKIFYSISNSISECEYKITLKVLKNKNGDELILAKDEEERKQKLKNSNFDVFISGWSRYPIQKFVSDNIVCAMIYHGIGIKPLAEYLINYLSERK
ncbi:MAG: hypothetical protein H0Z29_02500 [Candidatus Marinimicrobia bacterium]|nr:hypothetical protein [Candidatus Neomarinimicrobiota bacterium]